MGETFSIVPGDERSMTLDVFMNLNSIRKIRRWKAKVLGGSKSQKESTQKELGSYASKPEKKSVSTISP